MALMQVEVQTRSLEMEARLHTSDDTHRQNAMQLNDRVAEQQKVATKYVSNLPYDYDVNDVGL